MVNTTPALTPTTHQRLRVVIGTYVAIVSLTVATLAVLSAAAADQAPSEAWVHAVIVAVFAALLPVRLKSAARGSVGGLRAVGIICAVVFVVNVVESLLTMFPTWMRVEMIVIALLMLVGVGLVIRERV